jgi:hypothetical protein
MRNLPLYLKTATRPRGRAAKRNQNRKPRRWGKIGSLRARAQKTVWKDPRPIGLVREPARVYHFRSMLDPWRE